MSLARQEGAYVDLCLQVAPANLVWDCLAQPTQHQQTDERIGWSLQCETYSSKPYTQEEAKASSSKSGTWLMPFPCNSECKSSKCLEKYMHLMANFLETSQSFHKADFQCVDSHIPRHSRDCKKTSKNNHFQWLCIGWIVAKMFRLQEN
jgi:hypothetical protein